MQAIGKPAARLSAPHMGFLRNRIIISLTNPASAHEKKSKHAKHHRSTSNTACICRPACLCMICYPHMYSARSRPGTRCIVSISARPPPRRSPLLFCLCHHPPRFVVVRSDCQIKRVSRWYNACPAVTVRILAWQQHPRPRARKHACWSGPGCTPFGFLWALGVGGRADD